MSIDGAGLPEHAGDLSIDEDVYKDLHATNMFQEMDRAADEVHID